MKITQERAAELRREAQLVKDRWSTGGYIAAANPATVLDLLDDRDELLAEVAKLRAKCEERKAVLLDHERCFEDAMDHETMSRFYCQSCGEPAGRDHEPGCAWKRAMEDA